MDGQGYNTFLESKAKHEACGIHMGVHEGQRQALEEGRCQSIECRVGIATAASMKHGVAML